MDFKKKNVEAMADGAIDVSLVNGAVRTSEQEEMAHLLRRKSKLLIAYGACAQLGGIPGLANQFSRERILDYVYRQAPTVVNGDGVRPMEHYVDAQQRETELPRFHNVVRSLDQVVDVDYTLPGCPPTPALLKAALEAILTGKLPPKGSVLAPDVALCDQCPRKESKPTDLAYTEFKRPHMVLLDPEKCFLAQGVVCMGPSTRGGCESRCIGGYMPCTGCFGPTSRVLDQGAKMLSSLCSAVEAKEPEEIDRVLAGIPDPVGTFYRYGLPHSRLRGHVTAIQPAMEEAHRR
jgi:F420-non-reducing hydrogenase small subunit